MDESVVGLLYLGAKRFLYHLRTNIKVEDKNKYDEFQKLVRDFKDKPLGSPLRYEILKLFGDYPALEAEFTSFLPAYATEYKYYVKETLKGEEELLEQFWRLLEEYKSGRMIFQKFNETVSLLFKDHQDLVQALQFFIVVDAVAYSSVVWEHFVARNEVSKYQEFVRLLDGVRARRGKFPDVRINFVELFQNDRRLIEGLNRFLPENECLEFNEGEGHAVQRGINEGRVQEPSTGDQQSIVTQVLESKVQEFSVGDRQIVVHVGHEDRVYEPCVGDQKIVVTHEERMHTSSGGDQQIVVTHGDRVQKSSVRDQQTSVTYEDRIQEPSIEDQQNGETHKHKVQVPPDEDPKTVVTQEELLCFKDGDDADLKRRKIRKIQ
ncbi:hypothetical protein R1flu_003536 [Riccia fluitans]|uniref:Uncharacterized protein n=1 Tax=Riccia fluitans TaxID=41844 RepID=A0ABD1Y9A9_9MARC